MGQNYTSGITEAARAFFDDYKHIFDEINERVKSGELKEEFRNKTYEVLDVVTTHEKAALKNLEKHIQELGVDTEEFASYLTYAALLIMAVIPIYVGSKAANAKAQAIIAEKNACAKSGAKYTATNEAAMTRSEAMTFPIFASFFLFGLYLIFRIIGPEWVNYLMTFYFVVGGSLVVGRFFSPVFKALTPSFFTFMHEEYDILFTPSLKKKAIEVQTDSGKSKEETRNDLAELQQEAFLNITFDLTNIVALVFGIIVGIWYLYTKHWISNNIFGICFASTGIQELQLGSFQVACILLTGLFFYDVFWVFGTDVMVTVAQSFDAPIKVLFPKDVFSNGLIEAKQFGMLGLGDIVLPGIVIALLLRFDYWIDASNSKSSSSIYFNFTMIAYILGLIFTMFIMHVYRHAQPALLYLVPACLITPILISVVRGHFSKLLFEYSESQEEDELKEKEKSE